MLILVLLSVTFPVYLYFSNQYCTTHLYKPWHFPQSISMSNGLVCFCFTHSQPKKRWISWSFLICTNTAMYRYDFNDSLSKAKKRQRDSMIIVICRRTLPYFEPILRKFKMTVIRGLSFHCIFMLFLSTLCVCASCI